MTQKVIYIGKNILNIYNIGFKSEYRKIICLEDTHYIFYI